MQTILFSLERSSKILREGQKSTSHYTGFLLGLMWYIFLPIHSSKYLLMELYKIFFSLKIQRISFSFEYRESRVGYRILLYKLSTF